MRMLVHGSKTVEQEYPRDRPAPQLCPEVQLQRYTQLLAHYLHSLPGDSVETTLVLGLVRLEGIIEQVQTERSALWLVVTECDIRR